MSLEDKQLDLFDLPGRITEAPRSPASRSPGPLLAPVHICPPPSLPSAARWREVEAPTQTIGFILKRSRRRSIGLVVNDDGLQVTAPNWVTLAQIDAAVLDKARWILEKLRQYDARRQHLAMADTYWKDGASIPYFGQRIVLGLGFAGRSHQLSGEVYAPDLLDDRTENPVAE